MHIHDLHIPVQNINIKFSALKKQNVRNSLSQIVQSYSKCIVKLL